MDFLNSLNPEQREAVLQVDGPLLILAGAGSGKTRVIAYRVAYLVGSGLADASEVLAVTFTNKAAEEMRDRVEALLGANCGRLWVSTFHAFWARILRREAPALGLSRDFVIYDSSDQLSVVKQVLKDLQIDESFLQPRAVLSRISHARNRMESPEAIAAGGDFRDERFAKVYRGYVDMLAAKGRSTSTTCCSSRSSCSKRSRGPPPVQPAVPLHHGGRIPGHQPAAVPADHPPGLGAPEPRGGGRSRPVDLQVARRRHPEHPRFRTGLPRGQNRQARAQLPIDADHPGRGVGVIRNNRNRKDKALWTERKGGARIQYARCGDELEEADFAARTARAALAEDAAATVAILYRTNAQSRVLEDALRRANVVYRIIGSVRFYERKEIKDTLVYLKLLLNPHDNVSLRRVINVPPRGIGKTLMDGLEAAAEDEGPSEADVERHPLLGAGLAPVCWHDGNAGNPCEVHPPAADRR